MGTCIIYVKTHMPKITLLLFSLICLNSCQHAFRTGKPVNPSATVLLFPVYVQIKQHNPQQQETTVDTNLSQQKELLFNQLTERTLTARYKTILAQPDPATRDSLWSELFTVFGEIGKQGHIRGIPLPSAVKKLLIQSDADVAFGLVHLGTTGPDQTGYLINTSVVFDRKTGSVIRYGSNVLEKQYPKSDSVIIRLTEQLINRQMR